MIWGLLMMRERQQYGESFASAGGDDEASTASVVGPRSDEGIRESELLRESEVADESKDAIGRDRCRVFETEWGPCAFLWSAPLVPKERKRKKRKRRVREEKRQEESRKTLEDIVLSMEQPRVQKAISFEQDDRPAHAHFEPPERPPVEPQPRTARPVSVDRESFISRDEKHEVSLLKHYVLLFGAAVLCGWLLSLAEGPKEIKLKNRAYRRSQRIKSTLDQGIEDGWIDEGFRKDIKEVCDFVSDKDRQIIDFDVAGSTFFVATVISTIGYGTYAPRTPTGRAITCFIAIVGVAWFGYVLSVAASRCDYLVRYAVVAWRKGLAFTRAKLSRKERAQVRRALLTPPQLFKFVLALNVAYIFALAVMGFASRMLTVGNGFYVAIITFSTVGLGDLAPPFHKHYRVQESAHAAELMCLTLITLVGLTLLAMLLSAVERFSAYQYRTFAFGQERADSMASLGTTSASPRASPPDPSSAQ
mmetsp:Transcript_8475/g.26428  ORF Transcript_8475/g.26428 Transcript_8475/m.26428 type:complete len:476 (-) Transcript_8475:413-1840(-)